MYYILLLVSMGGGWTGVVGRRAIMLSVVALIPSQVVCE